MFYYFFFVLKQGLIAEATGAHIMHPYDSIEKLSLFLSLFLNK